MSGKRESTERYVVGARLLGEELKTKKQRKKEKEYAIEVVLSDESQYTTYRTIKEIANLNTRLIERFPVEAGYFGKSERVIPTCPVKQTIFGPSRIVSDDRSFEKLLNSYLKGLPGLPASVVKSDLVQAFFALRATDINLPGDNGSTPPRKKRGAITVTEDSKITGPVTFKSYYAVATFSDPKSKFSFAEGAVVQVVMKDPSGWWMVDSNGKTGWAPAAFLVPIDEEDHLDEAQENEQLVGVERVGARYISMSSYQASRDDELSFIKGAVVKVIKKYVDGWWLVRYNGGEGFVPGSMFRKFDRRQGSDYVKGIRRKFISRGSTRIIPTLKPQWLHNPAEKPSERDRTRKGKVSLYQVVADFKGTDSDVGFVLSNDAVVKVLDKTKHGWWYVEDQHGRRGWAPATYLKPPMDKNRGRRKVIGTPHTVVKSHDAKQDDELTVDRGETVTVIWAADDGWWMVRNKETGGEGLVPSVCLKKDDGEGTCSLEPLEERCDESEENELTEAKEEDLDEYPDDIDAVDGDIVLEDCCVSIEDYAAKAFDELDLYEGQVVCVIDPSDPGYWYVNVDGKEGWVPSSTLTAIADRSSANNSSVGSSRDLSVEYSDQSDTEDSPWGESGDSPLLCVLRRSPCVIRRGRISPGGHPGLGRSLSSEVPDRAGRVNQLRRSVSEARNDEQEYIGKNERKISDVTIVIGDKTYDELEQEAAEAERLALEAQRRARELRETAQRVRAQSVSASYVEN